MESLIVFLVACQALGALIGAGSAVWAELAYLKAQRDGHLDRAERVHLWAIGRGLFYGMLLLLLASLGLVFAAYLAHSPLQPALSGSYWMLILFAVLIIIATFLLARGRISFALGSAAIFTAWWFLAYLTVGELPAATVGAALALYVVAGAVFYALLCYLRVLAKPA